jgi:hypothetical protein
MPRFRTFRFRTFVVAALLVCGLCSAQAEDTPVPPDDEQQKVALFFTLFEGMCPALLKAEFAKNANLSELGAPVIEGMSSEVCGCFMGELRAMPTAQVATLLEGKTRSNAMDEMVGRCTARSLKPHVGAMCMDYARGSEVADDESKQVCDCVHKRINDSDEDMLASLIGDEDKNGFRALIGECKAE